MDKVRVLGVYCRAHTIMDKLFGAPPAHENSKVPSRDVKRDKGVQFAAFGPIKDTLASGSTKVRDSAEATAPRIVKRCEAAGGAAGGAAGEAAGEAAPAKIT